VGSQPLRVDTKLDKLTEARTALSLLSTLQETLPRGKAAVPRFLGKHFGSPMSRFMRTRHGARLVLCPSSYDVYATMHSAGNAWDYHDFEICRAGLPDGGVFFEIGANVGYFALEQAWLDRSGKVYAFEPQTGLARAIAASADCNALENLQVFNALVGDHSGPATLYLAPGSIHASAVPDSGRPITSTVAMDMVSIDDLVQGGTIAPPDMIKMDVEGSEALVILGAARTLRDAKPNVFLEYMVEFDVGNRIRDAIDALLRDVPAYRLLASPRKDLKKQHQTRLFEIVSAEQWNDVDGIYLLNRDRPLRDPAFFPAG
jgi:FkbM family methyltransferase